MTTRSRLGTRIMIWRLSSTFKHLGTQRVSQMCWRDSPLGLLLALLLGSACDRDLRSAAAMSMLLRCRSSHASRFHSPSALSLSRAELLPLCPTTDHEVMSIVDDVRLKMSLASQFLHPSNQFETTRNLEKRVERTQLCERTTDCKDSISFIFPNRTNRDFVIEAVRNPGTRRIGEIPVPVI